MFGRTTSTGLARQIGFLWLVLGLAPVAIAQTTVIDEGFEDAVDDGTGMLTVPGVNLLGTAPAQITDDPDRGLLLSLTQGMNGQAGFAWFEEPFNLRENKVEIEFDLWIRSSTSADPADGMSVIFQFGDDINATGGGGGGLGTTNFPTDYVSVAFDIWDNGTADPETPCDTGNRTCHIEVNQNINPGGDLSTQTNVDFGAPSPDFTGVGDLLIPIRVRIVFDNGRIEVFLQTDGDEAFADDFVQVLGVVLDAFPDPADAIIGFAASTGGANAHHEIDNLLVVESEATPQVNVQVQLGDGDRGAINAGSAIEVAGDVNGETFTFVPDAVFGAFLGTDLGVIPNENRFADYGRTVPGNVGGPADPPVPVDNAGDEALQDMYQTERWNNGPVAYRFGVNSGRFEVNLHFAEICPGCGINPAGEPTRIVHVWVEGERVLAYWSAAEAAGEEAGTGPLARTAVVQTYQVDVEDGHLDVVVSDLGLLGTPPENAQINGISYRRLGDVSGAPIEGDLDDNAPAELPNLGEEVLLDTTFEDEVPGLCPEGWTCNGSFPVQVVDQSGFHLIGIEPRLQLTDNAGSLAASVIYNEPADLSARGVEAEFTVHLTRDLFNGNPPADGMTFFFLPGGDEVLTSVGGGGGAIGYDGIGGSGFAVEVDTWQGGTDPTGLNTTGSGHVGLLANGGVNNHVQHNVALNPDLGPPDWPVALVESDPLDPDNGQFLTNTLILEESFAAGLRVELQLNNGRFRVWISTVNEDDALGFVYPRTMVIDTLVDFGVTGLGEGFFGFSAGTGGAVTWHEVDDVRISLILNKDVLISRRIEPASYSLPSDRPQVFLDLTVEPGTGPHTVDITETLPPDWSAEGISDGGSLAGNEVTWNLTDIDADTTLSYSLIPPEGSAADVDITGSFSPNARDPLAIEASTVLFRPLPFGRDEGDLVIDEVYDDLLDGECPPGWTCNDNQPGPLGFSPGVTQAVGHEGRLRVAPRDNTIAGSVIYNTPIDLTQNSFVAEFDLYLSDDPGGNPPADGLTFVVLDADVSDEFALGGAGAGLGYQGLNGLAVEADTWQGGTDPSGFNTNGYAHVGVIRDGDVTNHVQTNIDLDPDLIPISAGGTGWPTFVDEFGTGFPLHFEIDYNNGNVQVFLSAPDTGEGEFPRTKVIDTFVTFPSDGEGDPVLQNALIGFTAATGGAWSDHEVDNVQVTLFEKTEGPVGGFVRGDIDSSGGLNITDAIVFLGWQFLGDEAPPCLDAADVDDSGSHNITDAIFLLQFQFLGTAPPPDPGPIPGEPLSPANCGVDPTDDDPFDCAETPPLCEG